MTNNLSHHQIAEYLVSNAISMMTKYLMEDTHCSIAEAMDVIYGSKLLELLQQEDDELYVQDPAYLYELLQQELDV